jgi:hypothetical protein
MSFYTYFTHVQHLYMFTVQGQVRSGVSTGGHEVGGEGRDHGRPYDNHYLPPGRHCPSQVRHHIVLTTDHSFFLLIRTLLTFFPG